MRSALLLALFAAALTGCGGGVSVPHRSDVDQQLRALRAPPRHFYFAGHEFAGLRLTAAVAQGAGQVVFVYGTCKIPAGQEGGCAPPVQIQIFPFDPSQWQRAVNCFRRPSLLGVPTVRHDGLVLLTRNAVVKIYARTPIEDRRVALALRDVREPGRVLRHLPLPAAGTRALISSVCH